MHVLAKVQLKPFEKGSIQKVPGSDKYIDTIKHDNIFFHSGTSYLLMINILAPGTVHRL